MRDQDPVIANSNTAGRLAFDRIEKGLAKHNFYWMSELNEEERTWENMIMGTDTAAEDWREETRCYDRQAFAKGFFGRFWEHWYGVADQIEV